jgi:hypothetical protein
VQIQGGANVQNVVKLEKKLEKVGPSISIALSEQGNTLNVWTIEVFVQYESLGACKLGAFTTNPPALGDPPNRIVAFATCPGAKGWWIQAKCPNTGALADLNLDSSECCAGNFGVQPNTPGTIPVNPPTILNTVSLGAAGSGRLIDVPLSEVVQDGTEKYVLSRRAFYVWEASNVQTADNNEIAALLANGVNPGRFVRKAGGDQGFRAQTTWHVGIGVGANAPPPGTVANNDHNGLTNATPLADLYELGRRWGYYEEALSTAGAQIDVFVHGAGGSFMAGRIEALCDPFTNVVFQGDRNITASGTVNTFTALVRGTSASPGGTKTSITTIAPTVFVTGQKLRISKVGAKLDARAIVDGNIGASTCDTTRWLQVPVYRDYGLTPTSITPANGDTFDVYDTPILTEGPFRIIPSGQPIPGTSSVLSFIDLDVGQDNAAGHPRFLRVSIEGGGRIVLILSGTIFAADNPNGLLGIVSCHTRRLSCGFASYLQGGNTGPTSNGLTNRGGTIGIDFDCYVENGFANVGNLNGAYPVWLFGTCAFFTTVILQPVGRYWCRTLQDGTHQMWGTTAAGTGVACSGNVLSYDTNAPGVLQNAGTNFTVDGLATAASFDRATAVWTPGIATSYANIAAATPGGFGGSALDPHSGGGLVKTS